jgi:hypothetical protein
MKAKVWHAIQSLPVDGKQKSANRAAENPMYKLSPSSVTGQYYQSFYLTTHQSNESRSKTRILHKCGGEKVISSQIIVFFDR